MTFYYSGGSNNTDILKSISGTPSSETVTQLFNNLTAEDVKLGKIEYILVFWKIEGAYKEVKFNTTPTNSLIEISLDEIHQHTNPDIKGVTYNNFKPKNTNFYPLPGFPFPLPIRENVEGYVPLWFRRTPIDGSDITESIDLDVYTIGGQDDTDVATGGFFLNATTDFTFEEAIIQNNIGKGVIGESSVL